MGNTEGIFSLILLDFKTRWLTELSFSGCWNIITAALINADL
jgi:hypothetical protein